MIKDNIILNTEDSKGCDKMEIALTIRNSTYDGEMLCSLVENMVINNCNQCNLKSICEGVDRVANDYLVSTTKVVSSFSFQ